MTINQFAERANLSPGTLRFYESKGLLLPAHRMENGYRLYSDEQLRDAYLINSLRQAGIGLADIRRFLVCTCPAEREHLLSQWQEQIASQLVSLQMAQSYLSGMLADRRDVHLIRWESEVHLLWFRHAVEGGPGPFAGPIRERRKQLQRAGIRIGPSSFVRTTGGESRALVGQVGFEIQPGMWKKLEPLSQGGWVERVPPTLFVGLECAFDDGYTRFRINRFLRDFSLEAVGDCLERHVQGQDDHYLLLIPVQNGIRTP